MMKRRLLYLWLICAVAGETTDFIFRVEITAPTLLALNVINNISALPPQTTEIEAVSTVSAEIKCAYPLFFNGYECQKCSVCRRPNIIVTQACTVVTDTVCDSHCLPGAVLMGGLCTLCPPGKYSTLTECVPCAAGTYSASVGTATCTPCAQNMSSRAGFTACVQVKKPSAKLPYSYLCSQISAL